MSVEHAREGRDEGEVDVTVLVVTYQGRLLVSACLDSLATQALDGLAMEVIVVDNASTDGTAEMIEELCPDVVLVRSHRNLGFAGGNNLGLRHANGRIVILLNNDAVADPGFVAALVGHLDAAPSDVAALSARVLLADRFRPAAPSDVRGRVLGADGVWVVDPEGPVRLVNSTGNLVRRDGFGIDRGWLARADLHHPEPEVFGFSGAACALRASALAEVGAFDPTFFMYYEDTDLSWRLQLAGYRIEYCAEAIAHHHHAASSGESSPFFRFHDARNRLLTLAKNASAGLALRLTARYIVTTASLALRRRAPAAHVWTRIRAFASFLRLLPAALRRRHHVGRTARASRRDVERLLVGPPSQPLGGFRTPPPG